MDCCKPENIDDNETKEHHGSCCGGGISGCGMKMWIVMGIVIAAIWYFSQ